jgi:protein-S-isoprenylcysteine O-methyltransferase Ste14
LLYRNLRVAAVGSGWFLLVGRLVVPIEERLLHNRFGATYDAYRDRVPRWIAVR